MLKRCIAQTLIIGFALASCGGDPASEAEMKSKVLAREIEKLRPVELSNEQRLEVCQAGLAFRGGRSANGISVMLQPDRTVRGRYQRETDSKTFVYDCKFRGAMISFRMIDEAGPETGPGEWSGSGSTTFFTFVGGGVKFYEKYGPNDVISEVVQIPSG